jgi:hypothetical protein
MIGKDPDRLLCPVRLSGTVVGLTCTRCAWSFKTTSDDETLWQEHFDAHLCEDFFRDKQATQV